MSQHAPNATTARAATQSGKIDLRDLSLIGLILTPSRPRALLRLPSGKVVSAEVGDTVASAEIVSIDKSGVNLRRNGRVQHRSMPR